ncbi:hypothetical protein VTI28DRAFT_3486 [Corynascus sepedonium]
MITGRLVSKPAACREIWEAADAVDAEPVMAASLSPSTRCRKSTRNNEVQASLLNDLTCRCFSREIFRRGDRTWGFLGVSWETTAEQHVPGCPIARIGSRNQTQSVSIRYTGLRRFLERAIKVSFSMRSGAGGWSISPGFTYYPTVDENISPVFRMMTILAEATRFMLRMPMSVSQGNMFVNTVLAKILELFRAGKASPLVVDSRNRSLLHYLTDAVSSHLPVSSKGGQQKPSVRY